MNEYRCLVVVGAQWGDEGKGKIVDVLSPEVDLVARYQGGANAGHTVDVAGDQFILHQIPSGILHPDKRCLLGNGVVLDPEQFFEEVDMLESRGIRVEGRVGISGRAHVILGYHKALEAAGEKLRGTGRIGTTGRGIGPAYEAKVARRGIRVAELRRRERARELVRAGAEHANRQLAAAGAETLDVASIVDMADNLRERLLPLLTDTGLELARAMKDGARILLEGAQGTLLDVDHGTYPFVTSSNTVAGCAATGLGMGPTAIDGVLGVIKAYTTRVGGGPFPSELPQDQAGRLRELGAEFGATTGRPRRCGWFDAVVGRLAVRVNGLTGLAVTKLDVLDCFEEICIATAYEIDGETVHEFPDEMEAVQRARPVYETLPGWRSSTAAARCARDLPQAARDYLGRLEELLGVPIWFVSVGTEREQIIKY